MTNNKLSNGAQHWLEPEREEEPAPAPPSASEELGQSLLQLMAAQVMLWTKITMVTMTMLMIDDDD